MAIFSISLFLLSSKIFLYTVSFWKARFGAECVSAVVQGTLTSRAPRYSIILELDRKVRDMELPVYAYGPAPQGVGLAQTMSHFMPTNYRELSEPFHLLLCLFLFFVGLRSLLLNCPNPSNTESFPVFSYPPPNLNVALD